MPLETAETESIGSGSDRDDHVSRRRVVGLACCLEVCKTSRLFRKENEHTACAVLAGTNFLRSGKFQKDLILLVRGRCLGELIRGLQNLGAPGEGVRIGTFCGVQKVPQKHAEGCDPLDSRGTIQSSVGEDFSRVFRWHEPKPVFRTKRRRKGFESVRGSGFTA